jgi:hypothetical protein
MKKWPKELVVLKSIVNAADFDTKLAELTFLETESLIRRFKRLGDTPEARATQDLWTEVVARCTLNRGNERAGTRGQQTEATNPADGETETGERPPSWKDTAIEEVEFIRLN